MKENLTRYFNKFYDFIDKIGKQNFILIVFILVVLLVTSLYKTFSLYTESNGTEIVDGLINYKFILTNNEENSVTIAAGSDKNLMITVTNPGEIKLKYGLYYSSSNDLTDVNIGYLYTSEHLPNGLIDSKKDCIITIKIDNNSSNSVTLSFGVKYGFEGSEELALDTNQNWINKSLPIPLSTVEPGSYVSYSGTNGCTGASCNGQNANYVSDTDMGYCYSSSYKFDVNGWRVGYIKDNTAYLVAAGSTDCLCTNSDGTTSNSNCDTSLSNEDIDMHFANLNQISLKYCNSSFAYGGVCDTSSTWAMNATDFLNITGEDPSLVNATYYNNNNLIGNGGYYWYATNDGDNSVFYWDSDCSFASNDSGICGLMNTEVSSATNGVRPVLRLESSVLVVGGTGTYNDPYIIDNPNTIKDLANNMNNGLIMNGATWNKEIGTVSFDGVNDWINAGLVNYDFGDSVSFVTRVMFTKISSLPVEFIGNWEQAGGGLRLNSSGYMDFQLFLNGSYIQTSGNTKKATPGQWYIAVGTYDGSTLSLYIDGEKVSTASSSGNIQVSSMPIMLGGNLNPSAENGFDITNLMNGVFSDVLVFDRALTESEIATDYSTSINPTNLNNLLIHYDFKR